MTFSSRNVGVAAEAVVACQFARCGFDVSVQYGANQPEYDLIVARGEELLKVSVKGSQDGSWGLTQTHLAKLKGANYHGAIAEWLQKHGARTVLCFVQFRGVQIHELPRLYLATPKEVACQLRITRGGLGDTILHERHEWGTRAVAAGTVDEIPAMWKLSKERIAHLFQTA
jgi:Holliday junction resolvase-like predicted endonuclease